MNDHAHEAHGVVGAAFRCLQCEFFGADPSYIVQHSFKHPDERPFQCSEPERPSSFKRLDDLQIHIQRYHIDVVWTCPDCASEMPLEERHRHVTFARCNEDQPADDSTPICGLARCTAQILGDKFAMRSHRLQRDKCVGCGLWEDRWH